MIEAILQQLLANDNNPHTVHHIRTQAISLLPVLTAKSDGKIKIKVFMLFEMVQYFSSDSQFSEIFYLIQVSIIL